MNDENKIINGKPTYRAITYQTKITEDFSLMICGTETCLPDYYFNTDGRNGYHLHAVLKGRGVLSVDGKEQEVHFGHLFITKPGEDTWYRADSRDPWVYCWMAFDGRRAQEFAERAGFVKGVNVLDCCVNPERLYDLCKRVLNMPEPTTANVIARTGLLLEFISLAIESHDNSEKHFHKTREYPTDTYVKYAADFIRGNYATAKISDVAGYIGIHRSYLTSIFKEKMGISPQEYLIQCKLQKAITFLIETNNPIQEIARQVGYDNPLTFSKTFKNFYGVSPKLYRQQHREADMNSEKNPKELPV